MTFAETRKTSIQSTEKSRKKGSVSSIEADGARLSGSEEKPKPMQSKKPKCLESTTPNPKRIARMETITDQIKLIQGNKVKAKFKLKGSGIWIARSIPSVCCILPWLSTES